MSMDFVMMSENEILSNLMDMGEWDVPEFTLDSEDDFWGKEDW